MTRARICPFAQQKMLSENQSQIPVRGVVVHSTGGNSLPYAYFETGTNLESTFGLDFDGTLEQYMYADERADANNKANGFLASVETVGDGHGPWTPDQIAKLVKLLDWYATEYSIPRRLADAWDGSGFGYHIQFPEWHAVPKICPGPRRIQQFKQIVIPALAGSYTNGVAVTDADMLKIIAGVDAIFKDDIKQLDARNNAYVTNGINRAVRDLGGEPSVANKTVPPLA